MKGKPHRAGGGGAESRRCWLRITSGGESVFILGLTADRFICILRAILCTIPRKITPSAAPLTSPATAEEAPGRANLRPRPCARERTGLQAKKGLLWLGSPCRHGDRVAPSPSTFQEGFPTCSSPDLNVTGPVLGQANLSSLKRSYRQTDGRTGRQTGELYTPDSPAN